MEYRLLLVRYTVVTIAIVGFFTQFVACGSKFYQVSVEDDVEMSGSPAYTTDKSSEYYGIHSLQGWSNLPINIYFGESISDHQELALSQAMSTWEVITGVDIFSINGVHNGVDGDYFTDLYSSLDDFINGQYLDDDWKKTGKKSLVLATTIWNNGQSGSNIIAADVRYNTEHYQLGDSLTTRMTDEREVVDLQSLALHEIGHFIGLGHVADDIDAFSVMNPHMFVGENMTARRPTQGDIERIQKIYGCQQDACDVETMVEKIEMGDFSYIGVN